MFYEALFFFLNQEEIMSGSHKCKKKKLYDENTFFFMNSWLKKTTELRFFLQNF